VVQEPLSGICRDPDEQVVGKDASAARDGAPVAAGLADHGGGFARDCGLVNRGGTLHDLAVTRDEFARGDDHQVALPQEGRVHGLDVAIGGAALCDQLLARGTQRPGLRLAAPLGHGLGEIREDDGEEQPQCDLEHVAEWLLRGEELLEGQDGADQGDEHHRVLDLLPRTQLRERVHDGLLHDVAVEQGNGFGAHGGV